MRGADTFTENLFAMRRLNDFAPESHPLRPVRKLVNQARVANTLIQACAGHKSFTRKDGAGDDMGNFENTKCTALKQPEISLKESNFQIAKSVPRKSRLLRW